MKSMTNTANVENAGSINNPPGCLTKAVRRSPVPSLEEEDVVSAVFLARSVSKKAGIGGSGGYPWIHQQIYVSMFLGDGAGEGRGILLIIQ